MEWVFRLRADAGVGATDVPVGGEKVVSMVKYRMCGEGDRILEKDTGSTSNCERDTAWKSKMQKKLDEGQRHSKKRKKRKR